MDSINQIWPKWHTVELIGRGAFGEVYKVKREELGETFYSAVKVIQIPRDDSEVREFLSEGQTSQSIRFYYESIAKGLMNEIKVLEQLKSAGNVVNIEEFEILEKEDGIGWDAYIRMELLRNLNEYRQGRQMHWQEVEKLGMNICKALEYCEQCRIIHRDIKPSNIFVDNYGNFKLGDFGIARQLEKTQSTLSQKGTEMYMAPEVRFGDRKSSYNVDLYSLGLVMYRLLNRNKMPFEPLDRDMLTYQDKEEALSRRLRGDRLPLPADAPAGLGQIIIRACEADRDKRYQRASEMYADLAKWQRREAEEAEPKERKRAETVPAAAPPGYSSGKDEPEEETVSAFRFESVKSPIAGKEAAKESERKEDAEEPKQRETAEVPERDEKAEDTPLPVQGKRRFSEKAAWGILAGGVAAGILCAVRNVNVYHFLTYMGIFSYDTSGIAARVNGMIVFIIAVTVGMGAGALLAGKKGLRAAAVVCMLCGGLIGFFTVGVVSDLAGGIVSAAVSEDMLFQIVRLWNLVSAIAACLAAVFGGRLFRKAAESLCEKVTKRPVPLIIKKRMGIKTAKAGLICLLAASVGNLVLIDFIELGLIPVATDLGIFLIVLILTPIAVMGTGILFVWKRKAKSGIYFTVAAGCIAVYLLSVGLFRAILSDVVYSSAYGLRSYNLLSITIPCLIASVAGVFISHCARRLYMDR